MHTQSNRAKRRLLYIRVTHETKGILRLRHTSPFPSSISIIQSSQSCSMYISIMPQLSIFLSNMLPLSAHVNSQSIPGSNRRDLVVRFVQCFPLGYYHDNTLHNYLSSLTCIPSVIHTFKHLIKNPDDYLVINSGKQNKHDIKFFYPNMHITLLKHP